MPPRGRSIAHGRGRVEQRMAGRAQVHLPRRLHRAAVPGAREGGGGEGQVEPRQGLDHRVERLALLPHQAREHAQDALLLLGLLGGELAGAVVGLHQRDGFHEDRLARPRAVVDDAGHGGPRRRLHRQHRPAPAHRGEALLQVRPQAYGQVAQQVGRRPAGPGEPPAHRCELRRRGVEQAAVRVERPRQRALHPPRRAGRRRGDHLRQERRLLLARGHGLRRLEPDADGGQHLGQRLGVEHRVARRLGRRVADVERAAGPAHAEVAQHDGLLGAREARGDLRRVRRGREREGQRAPTRERRQPRDPLPDGGQLQQLGAPRVHPADGSPEGLRGRRGRPPRRPPASARRRGGCSTTPARPPARCPPRGWRRGRRGPPARWPRRARPG